MRKCDAYDVGERNHHYFTFQRKSENGVVRTSVNGTYFSPMESNATIWKVSEQDFSDQNLNAQSPKWDFGKNQLVLVSRDSGKAAQIVMNSGSMMMHPFHLHGNILTFHSTLSLLSNPQRLISILCSRAKFSSSWGRPWRIWKWDDNLEL
uniref:Plastocyanin-like domain-containing protein n=1 Tax=Bionectria ochroleuca TaxID=29856 RepID=A0A8H7TRW3_BIOOC